MQIDSDNDDGFFSGLNFKFGSVATMDSKASSIRDTLCIFKSEIDNDRDSQNNDIEINMDNIRMPLEGIDESIDEELKGAGGIDDNFMF